MSPGAKVFLTLAGAGAVIGGIILFTSKKAKAQTLPEVKDDTAPPDVVVPDEAAPLTPPGTVPPFVPPFPQFTPTPAPPGSATNIQTLPDGSTFNPSTGIITRPDGSQILPGAPPPPAPPAPPVQPLPPPVVTTVPTPVGPVQVTIPPGVQSVPVVVPVPLPDVLASQQGGQPLPPPPATVPLPPIAPQPPGPVPVPPVPIPVLQPAPAPAPIPVATAPAPSSPVSTVPKDTAAMVAALLDAETRTGWNVTSAQVTAWQKSRGLVQDGKYGPKSALTVALELATIPIIRFWPKGSQKAPELEKYRLALFELASEADAAGNSARAAQLRFAADREKAQAFGAVSGKAPPISPELRVSLAKVA